MSEYMPPYRAKQHQTLINVPDLYQDIIDFHMKYDLEGRSFPAPIVSENLQAARIIHMHEELHEYMKAVQKDDMLNALDALVDLVYVALGTAYFHGFDFNEAWRRVHDANMRKVRVDAAENSKRGTKFDVVKPEGWVGPNLEDLV